MAGQWQRGDARHLRRGRSARHWLSATMLASRTPPLLHHPELGQNRGEVPVLAVPLDQSVVSQFEDRSHAHVDLLPRAWWQWAELPAVGPGEIPLHDGTVV